MLSEIIKVLFLLHINMIYSRKGQYSNLIRYIQAYCHKIIKNYSLILQLINSILKWMKLTVSRYKLA